LLQRDNHLWYILVGIVILTLSLILTTTYDLISSYEMRLA